MPDLPELPHLSPPPAPAVRPPPLPPRTKPLSVGAVLAGVVLFAVLGGITLVLIFTHRRPPPPRPAKDVAGFVPAESPATALRERPFVNSLGMRFIPAGTGGELMSVWETRVSDFAAYMDDVKPPNSDGMLVMQVKPVMAGLTHERTVTWQAQASWRSPGFIQDGDHPVVGVTLVAARHFAAWLTGKERKAGLLPEGAFYAVPIAEEWEAAAGEDLHPFGPWWPPAHNAGNYWDAAASARLPGWDVRNLERRDDGTAFTAPVGSYLPNAFGLHDLGGNVAEWCDSHYDPSDNTDEFREELMRGNLLYDFLGLPYYIVRGGSWYTHKDLEAETSARVNSNCFRQDSRVGCRLVLIHRSSTAADFARRGHGAALRHEFDAALLDANRAIELDAQHPDALEMRADLHRYAGRYADALADLEVLEEGWGEIPVHANDLAWLLATCPDAMVRDGSYALELAERACDDTDRKAPSFLDTLAAAYAETGEWEKAVSTQQAAMDLLASDATKTRADFQSRLDLYRAQQPYRSHPKPLSYPPAITAPAP